MTTRPLGRPLPSTAGISGDVPPEAIVKTIELVITLARGGMQIASDREAFEHEMEMLQAKEVQVRERLQMLVQLVDHSKISDEARGRIVDAVCELALR